jgi:uncharacterized protein with NRDE domain
MCLIALAVAPSPTLALVVIANRDEHYARPTTPMHAWGDGIVAGVDRERGGTWMGVRVRPGEPLRFAAVTNVRDPADLRPKEPGEPSRGDLVRGFLASEEPARTYVARVAEDRVMRGFNLLALDESGLYWCSNRAPAGQGALRLSPGIHGLSNALLDTPWPKVETAKARLAAALAQGEPAPDALFAILADDARPDDALLPDTGVGLALERDLAPIRIALPTYGTRCSTVLVARADRTATLIERTIAPGPASEARFELDVGTTPA